MKSILFCDVSEHAEKCFRQLTKKQKVKVLFKMSENMHLADAVTIVVWKDGLEQMGKK